MDVTIFSAANCGKCFVTANALRKKGIEFTEVKVDQNPAVEASVKNAFGGGMVPLPVIMAFRHEDDEVPDIWTDFHPQYFDALNDPSIELPDPH